MVGESLLCLLCCDMLLRYRHPIPISAMGVPINAKNSILSNTVEQEQVNTIQHRLTKRSSRSRTCIPK